MGKNEVRTMELLDKLERRAKAKPEGLVSNEFIEKRMQEIAGEIERGAAAESFTDEIDRLLSTGLPARDREAEAVYEERRRALEEL